MSSKFQTTSTSPPLLAIDHYDGAADRFRRWKESVLLRLRTLDLSHVLFSSHPSAEVDGAAAVAEWARDDSLCRGHILETLSDRLFDLHAHRATAKSLWDDLGMTYGVDEEVARRSAYEKFVEFQMVDGKSIMQQLAKLQALAAQGVDAREKTEDADEKFLVTSIIAKLPPSWAEFAKWVEEKGFSLDQLWDEIRKEAVMRRNDEKAQEEKEKEKEEKEKDEEKEMIKEKVSSRKRSRKLCEDDDDDDEKTPSLTSKILHFFAT